MTDKEALDLTKKLRKKVLKDFGKNSCGEMTMDCASCQSQVFLGYLNWYINLLEFSMDPDRSNKKLSKKNE